MSEVEITARDGSEYVEPAVRVDVDGEQRLRVRGSRADGYTLEWQEDGDLADSYAAMQERVGDGAGARIEVGHARKDSLGVLYHDDEAREMLDGDLETLLETAYSPETVTGFAATTSEGGFEAEQQDGVVEHAYSFDHDPREELSLAIERNADAAALRTEYDAILEELKDVGAL